MTDSETLDKARALFVGQTQGDTLAREVIAIAEQREHTIACEVEHSRKLEDQLKTMHGLLPVIETSGRYSAGRFKSMRLYGLCSVGGGSHVAHVVHAKPVTKHRARKRRRFMTHTSLPGTSERAPILLSLASSARSRDRSRLR